MNTESLPFEQHWSLSSAFNAIEPVCGKLCELLKRHGFQSQTFIIDLLLREAFANAADHGNNLDPAKKVACEIRLYDATLEIEITDEGKGFDWKAKNELKSGTDLDECGRGIAIYFMYADEVKFNDSGNSIFLRKKLVCDDFSSIADSQSTENTEMHAKEIVTVLDSDLTAGTDDDTRPALMNAVNATPSRYTLAIDMKKVRTMDSRGMALLIAIHKALHEKQCTLRLFGLSRQLLELLKSVNFDRHFDISL